MAPSENRTRDLPVCSAVPQPTATPRAALSSSTKTIVLGPLTAFKYQKCLCNLRENYYRPVASIIFIYR
jgi:hypothetical protein